MGKRDVAIIGSGLGGLALAMRLAARGYRTRVLEKSDGPGGRCGEMRLGKHRFDTGPTLLLMIDALEHLFAECGLSLGDYLRASRVNPNYRIHYADGSSIVWLSDVEAMADQLEELRLGQGAAFRRCMAEAGEHFRISRRNFVERDFDSYLQYLAPRQVQALFRAHAHRNLWRYVRSFFPDERICQSLTFQSMYLGTSPYESPAIYTLLPYTEMAEGIWYPEGGLYAVPEAMRKAAEDLGVAFEFGREVTGVRTDGRRVERLETADGEAVETDLVVANEDLPHFLRTKLGESLPRRPWSWRYSAGVILLFFGLSRRYEALSHHNIVLPAFESLFADISRRRIVPERPAFYICDPSKTDPSVAPEGGSAVYVLVPCPTLEGRVDWDAESARVREYVLDGLERLGCDGVRDHVTCEARWTPVDFRDRLNLEHGSAFGLGHQFTQVSHLRPHNYHPRLGNLFFVGASARPGTGIPMVVFGSAITRDRVEEAVARGR